MNISYKLAALVAAYLILGGCFAQDEITPVNAPEIRVNTIHLMTAEERSTIIIKDIWQQPELDRVKIGKGGSLGAIRKENTTPIGPYGWQAFTSQDAISSWIGSYEAVAYGGL